ncbi:MAG: IS630 family transposase [Flavobacteriaceae bacterium]|nr:IS630 family transposase [Flavobacteriaceae bacterium]
MEKIDFRTLPNEERYNLRKRAILLLKSGKKQNEIADLYGVRTATVNSWVKLHKELGSKGLEDKKRGVKSEDKKLLSKKCEKAIQKMIIDTMPDQLSLPCGLWTRKAVMELVEREFEIKLAINTMGDYLRSWGFSPQKPKKRAYEQCPKKVQKWLDQEYPAIKEKAKKEGAVIHWGDETGARNVNQHGRSYAPKGKTPVKKNMAKRFSVNMISTVTNQGQVEFMIYTSTMNSERLIVFMEQLIKGKQQRIYLILDNLRVHHSKVVKQWLEEKKKQIEVYYLPSYSPEKNPDEYLNCDLKYGLSDKPAPKSQKQLQKYVEDHMGLLQKNKDRVKKYFHHKDIKYAA